MTQLHAAVSALVLANTALLLPFLIVSFITLLAVIIICCCLKVSDLLIIPKCCYLLKMTRNLEKCYFNDGNVGDEGGILAKARSVSTD